MFTYGYDNELPALVGIYSGTEPMRLAWEAEGEHADRMARRAAELKRRGLYLHVIDREVPPADALLRREIAKRAAAQVAPFDYAMVTSSAVTRGIVTVVLWFQKQDFHFTTVHANVEDALDALERRRGTRLPSVRKLYAKARADQFAAVPAASRVAR